MKTIDQYITQLDMAVTYDWLVATAFSISMGSVTVTSLLYTMLINVSKQEDYVNGRRGCNGKRNQKV